jgi:hypothetical protein
MTVDNVITEWLIDGVWTSSIGGVNLDERVRKNPGVSITRGTSDQQSQPTAASSDYEVNNADGVFSNRNPNSPLYRKIPRYTQVRHRIPTASGSRDGYVLSLQPDESGGIATADKAGIEITGDIDIRFEITPDTWTPLGGYAIAGKYQVSGNMRSWLVWLDFSARFNLRWSTDGSAINDALFDNWPADYGRQAVRITLDVNNGAAGRTATLYRSDSINGTWTQVQQIIQAGTTSIYGLTDRPLELCDISNGSPITGQSMFYGKMHAFQLRNGIGGTVVAEMDPSSREIGTTSWADAYGNTWDITGTTRIGSDRIRHTGELDTITYDWDTTRRDAWLPQRTLGPLNRMQETGSPIGSALSRLFRTYPVNSGYWRLEDPSGSTRALGEGTSVNTSQLTDCSFTGSVPDGLPGSLGSLRLNSASSVMWLGAAGRADTGENSIIFCFKLSGLPASDKTLVSMVGNGTIRRWDFQVGAAGYSFDGYNLAGTQIVSEGILFGAGANPSTSWVMMQITLAQEGANVRYTTRWAGIGTSGWYTHSVGGETYAGSVGLIGQFRASAENDAAFVGAEFSHVLNARDVLIISTDSTGYYDAALAYDGEAAAVRAARLAAEEGIDLEIYGATTDSQLMGYQVADTPYNLINDSAKADNALLFDLRDRFAMGFRTRIDLESQFYSNFEVSLGQQTLAQVPRPVEDSRFTKNVFTASRPNGASYTFSLREGALSIAEPPDGIGPRAGSDSYNLHNDDQVQRMAEWQTYLRTRDELRIPAMKFEMHRTQVEVDRPELMERIIAAHLGDWAELYDLPSFVDPALVNYEIILGYVEQFNGHLWNIAFNVASADGYRGPRAEYIAIADDGTSVLAQSVTTTATTMDVWTPASSRPWIYTAHPLWPGTYQADVGGEMVSVTAVTDSVLDAAGRTSVSTLGSADIGGAYTTSGGSAANYNVSTGLIRITNATTNVQRIGYLTGQSAADLDLYWTTSVSAIALTQSILNFAIARLADPNNYLRFEVTFNTSSTVDIRIRKVIAGVDTSVALTSAVMPYSAGTLINAHARLEGSALKVKIWDNATGAESDRWHAEGTDSSILAAGFVGLGSLTNGGNTNVNVESRFDDLRVSNPQRFTVTRSVNDIVKAQDVGELVEYAQPRFLGL